MPAAPPAASVRPMVAADVAWSARTHAELLPHGLFPRLGGGFVRRWHVGHVSSPYGVALVAERCGEPVGFLVGSVDQPRHVSWTLQHQRGALAVRGVAGLLMHPRVLAVFVRTRLPRYAHRLLRRARTGTDDGAAGGSGAHRPVAVVAAVVVTPSARASGAGRLLVEAFLARAAQAGTGRAELVTLAGRDGASAFYESLGWERVDEHRNRDGELVRLYASATSPPGPAGERRQRPARDGRREGGTWLEPSA